MNFGMTPYNKHQFDVESKPTLVEVKRKIVTIKRDNAQFQVDAPTLMRAVRQLTQTIGEYKSAGNAYAQYIIPALRKARSDILSDLETYFNIHWEIDGTTGKSRFYK